MWWETIFVKAWREWWVDQWWVPNLWITKTCRELSSLASHTWPWWLLCTFHKLTTEKMLSRTSDRQTQLASTLGLISWMEKQYLTHIWAGFGSLSQMTNGKKRKSHRLFWCSKQEAGYFPSQHTYPAALFNHLLPWCQKTVHVQLIKLWLRGVFTWGTLAYGLVVFQHHLQGMFQK